MHNVLGFEYRGSDFESRAEKNFNVTRRPNHEFPEVCINWIRSQQFASIGFLLLKNCIQLADCISNIILHHTAIRINLGKITFDHLESMTFR
jgi:hypothetical protein